MAGERERGALPAGCVGAGPAVWFGGLMSGVVREKERETGEEERGGEVGKKGAREGGGDLSDILPGKLRKCPNNLTTKILGVTIFPSYKISSSRLHLLHKLNEFSRPHPLIIYINFMDLYWSTRRSRIHQPIVTPTILRKEIVITIRSRI